MSLFRLMLLLMLPLSLMACFGNDDDDGGSSDGYSEVFVDRYTTTNTTFGPDYTLGTGGGTCAIASEAVLCESQFSGGGPASPSGKLGLTNGYSNTNQRISASLRITGGDYNGSGSSALVVLWADNPDFDNFTEVIGCGLDEGQFVIRDQTGILENDSNTNVAVDGASFSVQMTIEGTSVTCVISGDLSVTLTYNLAATPDGNAGTGHPGVIAGWYDAGAERNFAYWDNLIISTK